MTPPGLYKLHRVMITTAVVFCAGYALRGLVLAATSRTGSAAAGFSAVFAAFLAIALGMYLRWLTRTKTSLTRDPRRRPPPPSAK